MKIYRKALSEEVYEYIKENSKDHNTFEHIFGNNLRVVIPLYNKKLLEIFKKLENAETKTKTIYKIDNNHEFAYRWMTDKNGNYILDPRPMRIGKVIARELGEKDADEWSRQENSIKSEDEDFSIILSRSPIDIVRMSDHYAMRSCHSPDREYFVHAEEEAIDGGAIAYVVKTQDIRAFIFENIDGADSIQNEEIFEDNQRRTRGIRPLSRLRINRYHDEDDESKELALPINRIYGEGIAGFYDTVRRWIYDKQGETVDYDNLYLPNYVRAGGGYADVSDVKIIKDFFGDNRGVTHDLEHKGGDTRVRIYEEELETINEKLKKILNHPNIRYFSEVALDDGNIKIDSSLSVNFEFDGVVDIIGDSWKYEDRMLNNIRNKVDFTLKAYGSIESLNIEVDNEKNKTIFTFRIDSEDEIINPDDYRVFIEDFARYVDNYDSDYNNLYNYLKKYRILYPSGEIQQEMYDPYIYYGEEGLAQNRPIISVPTNYKLKEEFNTDDIEQRNKISGWIKSITLKTIRKYMPKRIIGELKVITPYDNANRYPFITIFAKLYKAKEDANAISEIQRELYVIFREQLEDKSPLTTKIPIDNNLKESISSNWYRDSLDIKCY